MLLSVLLCVVAVMCGYYYLSRQSLVNSAFGEMHAQAHELAQLTLERESGNITKSGYERILDEYLRNDKLSAFATDEHGGIIMSTQNVGSDAGVFDALGGAIERALRGENVNLTLKDRALFVCGIPIASSTGAVRGSVFVLRGSDYILFNAFDINAPLIIATISAIPLITMLGIILARKAARPFADLSTVAGEMAQGNFDFRLDESQPGEVGELAKSLNALCGTLSQTIYQLRNEKSQLDQVLKSLTDGVAAIDANGQLTHFNPAMERIYSVTDNIKCRDDLIPDNEVWALYDEAYKNGESRSKEFKVLYTDRYYLVTAAPVFDINKKTAGVVGLFRDITEARHNERLQRDYISNITHEMRTPLTAIRGLLEPLSDGLVSAEDTQRYYKIMLHQVTRLSSLISDTMELTKLQIGTYKMHLGNVDMYELLNQITAGYQMLAAKKGVSLTCSVNKGTIARTDADRIEQIIVILIDNALKFTQSGGSIHISCKQQGAKKYAIKVADTGAGIEKEEQEFIFDRFYMVDKSRTGEGTGLGLAIAKQIMLMLGESISVESERGKGSEFTFTVQKA